MHRHNSFRLFILLLVGCPFLSAGSGSLAGDPWSGIFSGGSSGTQNPVNQFGNGLNNLFNNGKSAVNNGLNGRGPLQGGFNPPNTFGRSSTGAPTMLWSQIKKNPQPFTPFSNPGSTWQGGSIPTTPRLYGSFGTPKPFSTPATKNFFTPTPVPNLFNQPRNPVAPAWENFSRSTQNGANNVWNGALNGSQRLNDGVRRFTDQTSRSSNSLRNGFGSAPQDAKNFVNRAIQQPTKNFADTVRKKVTPPQPFVNRAIQPPRTSNAIASAQPFVNRAVPPPTSKVLKPAEPYVNRAVQATKKEATSAQPYVNRAVPQPVKQAVSSAKQSGSAPYINRAIPQPAKQLANSVRQSAAPSQPYVNRALQSSVPKLSQATNAVRSSTAPAPAINRAIPQGTQAITKGTNSIAQNLGSKTGRSTVALPPLPVNPEPIVRNLTPTINTARSSVANPVESVAAASKQFGGDVSRETRQLGGDASRETKVALGDTARELKDLGGDASRETKKAAGDATREVKDFGGDVAREEKKAMGDLSREAKNLAGDASREAKDLGGDLAREVKKAAGDATREAKDFGGDLAREGKKAAGDATRELKEFGGDASRESKQLAGDIGREGQKALEDTGREANQALGDGVRELKAGKDVAVNFVENIPGKVGRGVVDTSDSLFNKRERRPMIISKEEQRQETRQVLADEGYSKEQQEIMDQILFSEEGLQGKYALEFEMAFNDALEDEILNWWLEKGINDGQISEADLDQMAERAFAKGKKRFLAQHGLDENGRLSGVGFGTARDVELQKTEKDAKQTAIYEGDRVTEYKVEFDDAAIKPQTTNPPTDNADDKKKPRIRSATPEESTPARDPLADAPVDNKAATKQRVNQYIESNFKDKLKAKLSQKVGELKKEFNSAAKEAIGGLKKMGEFAVDKAKEYASGKAIDELEKLVPGVNIATTTTGMLKDSLIEFQKAQTAPTLKRDPTSKLLYDRENASIFDPSGYSPPSTNAVLRAANEGVTTYSDANGNWYVNKDPKFQPAGKFRDLYRPDAGGLAKHEKGTATDADKVKISDQEIVKRVGAAYIKDWFKGKAEELLKEKALGQSS